MQVAASYQRERLAANDAGENIGGNGRVGEASGTQACQCIEVWMKDATFINITFGLFSQNRKFTHKGLNLGNRTDNGKIVRRTAAKSDTALYGIGRYLSRQFRKFRRETAQPHQIGTMIVGCARGVAIV